jgi:hypothetical protein
VNVLRSSLAATKIERFSLRGRVAEKHAALNKTNMSATHAPEPASRSFAKIWLRKVVVFVAVTLIFGWFYGWASPWAFPQAQRPGFGYGMLHGALMPMALPSLVIGQDVEIYAAHNSGRAYKIGYIAGINVCGLIFFGSAFWRPRKRNVPPPYCVRG